MTDWSSCLRRVSPVIVRLDMFDQDFEAFWEGLVEHLGVDRRKVAPDGHQKLGVGHPVRRSRVRLAPAQRSGVRGRER